MYWILVFLLALAHQCIQWMERASRFQLLLSNQCIGNRWDIIFLWVARMIMAGYEWKGEKPFDAVYFTGMVRDKQRRKMSKQLGNSPEALDSLNNLVLMVCDMEIMASAPAGEIYSLMKSFASWKKFLQQTLERTSLI
jgi:valyl-tRNA synthetase